MEMVPAARRMVVLADAHTVSSSNMRSLQEAASARGVELVIRTVERPERIVPEIDEARRAGAEALNVLASPILHARRLDIFERTAETGSKQDRREEHLDAAQGRLSYAMPVAASVPNAPRWLP